MTEPQTTDLLRKRDEIGKRVPLRDKDLAEIAAINRQLGVLS